MKIVIQRSRFKSHRERIKYTVVEALQVVDALIYFCSLTLIITRFYPAVLFSNWMED